MSGISVTTPGGTTISIEGPNEGGDLSVYLSSQEYPDETHAGNLYDSDGDLVFSPSSEEYAIGPTVLRALADLIESTTQKETQP